MSTIVLNIDGDSEPGVTSPGQQRRWAVLDFEADLKSGALRNYPSPSEIRTRLGGKDLVCWCPLDQPCHADVLLELANPGAQAVKTHMSRPIYAIRAGHNQLRIAQQYARRPEDGLVVRVEQATSGAGHSVLMTPEQVAELRDTLIGWLSDSGQANPAAHIAPRIDQSVPDRHPQAAPGPVVAHAHQDHASIEAAVTKAMTEERERIAHDIELIEEFCKDYTFETGEVLIPRDVAATVARSGIGPTHPTVTADHSHRCGCPGCLEGTT